MWSMQRGRYASPSVQPRDESLLFEPAESLRLLLESPTTYSRIPNQMFTEYHLSGTTLEAMSGAYFNHNKSVHGTAIELTLDLPATHNDPPTPLGVLDKLPVEMRHLVYEQLFANQPNVNVMTYCDHDTRQITIERSQHDPRYSVESSAIAFFNLSLTSKSVRAEVTQMFWKHTKMTLYVLSNRIVSPLHPRQDTSLGLEMAGWNHALSERLVLNPSHLSGPSYNFASQTTTSIVTVFPQMRDVTLKALVTAASSYNGCGGGCFFDNYIHQSINVQLSTVDSRVILKALTAYQTMDKKSSPLILGYIPSVSRTKAATRWMLRHDGVSGGITSTTAASLIWLLHGTKSPSVNNLREAEAMYQIVRPRLEMERKMVVEKDKATLGEKKDVKSGVDVEEQDLEEEAKPDEEEDLSEYKELMELQAKFMEEYDSTDEEDSEEEDPQEEDPQEEYPQEEDSEEEDSE